MCHWNCVSYIADCIIIISYEDESFLFPLIGLITGNPVEMAISINGSRPEITGNNCKQMPLYPGQRVHGIDK